MLILRIAAVASALLIASAGLHAQAFIEHIEPPVVERGKTTRVTFVGREMSKAFDVWKSLAVESITVKPIESNAERAVFDMTVTENAPVGVCGLRVATPDGLSNVHLFLIDDLPVRPGVIDSPMSLAAPASVWGTLREGGVDRYRLHVKAGERLAIEAVANRLGKDADPLVTIRDAAGQFVAERDNDSGLYFDCRFEHVFVKEGDYTLEVRDARYKGNEHRSYVLRVGRFPAGRAATPASVGPGANEIAMGEAKFALDVPPDRLPGLFFAEVKRPDDDRSAWVPLAMAEGPVTVANEAGEPTPATVPGTLCGRIRTPGVKHHFAFKLEKGQKFYVRGDSVPFNSPAEIELSLQDRTGKELRKGTVAKGSDEVALEYTAGAAGEFTLLVRDSLRDGGDDFAYRIVARATPFPPQAAAEVEGLVVPQGSYQPVPIVVTRLPGTTGVIRLKLLGAPPGVSLSPEEVPETAASVVCTLSASDSAPVGLHTLQILAECNGDRFLVQTQPLVDRKFVNIDLIPLSLRDDQTRLPPSVADRFALQVTPASPFTFELPQRELLLVRYQRVPVPIETTRIAGFDGPITFSAKGGQLAAKEEGRTRVYAEFPAAMATDAKVNGFIQSLILSNLVKSRIEVTAVGTHQGRRVSLTRSFDLDLVPGFRVKGDPAKVSVLPGEIARTRLKVQRFGSFAGPVTIEFNPNPGVSLPERLVIPAGEDGIDFAVPVAADANPRNVNIQGTASGDVGSYEEEIRGPLFALEVRKPDLPKKETPKKK